MTLLPILAVTAALFTGCGDDKDKGKGDAVTTTRATESTTPAATTERTERTEDTTGSGMIDDLVHDGENIIDDVKDGAETAISKAEDMLTPDGTN